MTGCVTGFFFQTEKKKFNNNAGKMSSFCDMDCVLFMDLVLIRQAKFGNAMAIAGIAYTTSCHSFF